MTKNPTNCPGNPPPSTPYWPVPRCRGQSRGRQMVFQVDSRRSHLTEPTQSMEAATAQTTKRKHIHFQMPPPPPQHFTAHPVQRGVTGQALTGSGLSTAAGRLKTLPQPSLCFSTVNFYNPFFLTNLWAAWGVGQLGGTFCSKLICTVLILGSLK